MILRQDVVGDLNRVTHGNTQPDKYGFNQCLVDFASARRICGLLNGFGGDDPDQRTPLSQYQRILWDQHRLFSGTGGQSDAGEHAGLKQRLTVFDLVLQANLDAKCPRSFIRLWNDRDHFPGPAGLRQGGNLDTGGRSDTHEADVVLQNVRFDVDLKTGTLRAPASHPTHLDRGRQSSDDHLWHPHADIVIVRKSPFYEFRGLGGAVLRKLPATAYPMGWTADGKTLVVNRAAGDNRCWLELWRARDGRGS